MCTLVTYYYITLLLPRLAAGQHFGPFCVPLSLQESLRDCVALASMMSVNTFHYSTSKVLRLSKMLSSRAFRGTPTAPTATLQAQFRSRFRPYSSAMAPSSLSMDSPGTDIQKTHTTEIKGQSGRQYTIEHVLQDKGSLLGRVLLATYAIPNSPSMVY